MARKEARINLTTPNMATIQGYHSHTEGYSVNYAFQGFRVKKYFTSDRFILLDDNFNRPDGKPLQGYGLEVETECRGIRNAQVLAEVFDKMIFPHFPADLWKMQQDGSLGGDTSAECITQVMTKAAIRNMYPAFKAMFNTYFPAFGISATYTGNCGMHVNVSTACFGASEKSRELAVRKLMYILNHHYDLMVRVLYRNPHHTHWSGRMYEYTNKEDCKRANVHTLPSSHGNCFNGSHYDEGRVEIRLVGGQKDYGAFRNTMESVFHLVEAVKKLSWDDLDDVVKLFSGCNQYVFDRLNTRCTDYITQAQLDAIRATIQREALL